MNNKPMLYLCTCVLCLDVAHAVPLNLVSGVNGNIYTIEGESGTAGTHGWFDHGAVREGDDYASVWKFSQFYRNIAVYSNNTDPFVGDGFRSNDNELDAIGVFIGDPSVLMCNVNGDEHVDRMDINEILSRRNTPAKPGYSADFDQDGNITVLDARGCVRRCTIPGCSTL